jgi:putative transposase
MPCPHCGSATTQEQHKRTCLGYRTFRCVACWRRFNERSGTPLARPSYYPPRLIFRTR